MEDSPVEEDLSPELIPCRVCSRTFQSTSLKKHEKVCEKNAIKKRKPFDSLKQRVEGTDIAPFHQKSYIKKPEPTTPEVVKKKRQSWKEKHLELLNSIRAAKGVPSTETMPTSKSTSSFSADTERCPSCDRHFGPKAYDRHVEWCKEKKAHERLHQSPANVLLAKERLEARTKYVPPLNKAKKTPVREKYSPSFTGKAESTTSLVSQPSIRRKRIDNNNMAKSREKAAAEEKKEIAKKKSVKNIADERPKLHESKSMEDRRKDNVPSARSTSPRADSIKSYHKKKSLPTLKLNTTNINCEFGGLTVSSIKYDTDSKKLVTWKDTVSSESNISKCRDSQISLPVSEKNTAADIPKKKIIKPKFKTKPREEKVSNIPVKTSIEVPEVTVKEESSSQASGSRSPTKALVKKLKEVKNIFRGRSKGEDKSGSKKKVEKKDTVECADKISELPHSSDIKILKAAEESNKHSLPQFSNKLNSPGDQVQYRSVGQVTSKTQGFVKDTEHDISDMEKSAESYKEIGHSEIAENLELPKNTNEPIGQNLFNFELKYQTFDDILDTLDDEDKSEFDKIIHITEETEASNFDEFLRHRNLTSKADSKETIEPVERNFIIVSEKNSERDLEDFCQNKEIQDSFTSIEQEEDTKNSDSALVKETELVVERLSSSTHFFNGTSAKKPVSTFVGTQNDGVSTKKENMENSIHSRKEPDSVKNDLTECIFKKEKKHNLFTLPTQNSLKKQSSQNKHAEPFNPSKSQNLSIFTSAVHSNICSVKYLSKDVSNNLADNTFLVYSVNTKLKSSGSCTDGESIPPRVLIHESESTHSENAPSEANKCVDQSTSSETGFLKNLPTECSSRDTNSTYVGIMKKFKNLTERFQKIGSGYSSETPKSSDFTFLKNDKDEEPFTLDSEDLDESSRKLSQLIFKFRHGSMKKKDNYQQPKKVDSQKIESYIDISGNNQSESFVFLFQSSKNMERVESPNSDARSNVHKFYSCKFLKDPRSKISLKRSSSDIIMVNSSTSKNLLKSINFDKDNSKKISSSMPNLNLHSFTNIKDLNSSRQLSEKEVERRRVLQIAANEFIEEMKVLKRSSDIKHSSPEEYSVPKKKRKIMAEVDGTPKARCSNYDLKLKMKTMKKRHHNLRIKSTNIQIAPLTPVTCISLENEVTGTLPEMRSNLLERRHRKLDETPQKIQKSDKAAQIKLPPISARKPKGKEEKSVQVNFFEKLPRCLDRRFVGSKYFLKLSAGKRNSTPDPYTLAQLQFMELLECNDFKSLTTTPTPLKNTKVTDHQNNKTSEKTSKKPSKKLFKDSLESLTDDFELMESLIDENFKNGNDNVSSNRSSLHNKIPGDDNFPIDPSLINENDNLSLPEHFVLDEDSPESVIDTNFLVTTKQTERTEKKSTSSSTTRPNTTKPKLTVNKATPNKKKPSESLITKPKSSTSQKSAIDKNLGKTPKKTVSSSIKSVSSSFSSERILRSEEGRFKKNSPEPIPTISTSIKNRKNTRTSPEHEENVGDWFNNDLNRSPDDSLKPEDLFAVDDDMYEEFKKYEEMYLKEKKQNKPRKNKPKLIEINYKILTEENQGHVKNQVAGDSAYGSLTRNTPDHHVKLPTLPLMDSNLMDSVIVDEEDCTSPDLPKKISKFCHECGNRYPLASAKFCVECGVRRLIL